MKVEKHRWSECDILLLKDTQNIQISLSDDTNCILNSRSSTNSAKPCPDNRVRMFRRDSLHEFYAWKGRSQEFDCRNSSLVNTISVAKQLIFLSLLEDGLVLLQNAIQDAVLDLATTAIRGTYKRCNGFQLGLSPREANVI